MTNVPHRKKGCGSFCCMAMVPEQAKLNELLAKEQVMAVVGSLRAASQAFAGVFEYIGNEIVLTDKTYGEAAPEYPQDQLLSLAAQIRDAGSPLFKLSDSGTPIMGAPIFLRYGGRDYIKGCLAGIPPAAIRTENESNMGALQVLAGFLSDSASASFNNAITNREQQEVEQELRLDRSRLAAVIGSIGAGLVLVNRNMHITWHNSVIVEQFGISDLLGRLCYEAFRDSNAACGDCPVRRTFETGQQHTGKFISLYPGPKTRHFDVTTTPVFDLSGQVSQVLELVHDVTDKQEAMDEKDRFFRSVSHELRTPLTSIVGFIEMMRDSSEMLSPEQETMLSRIDENAQRLVAMVNNLLDLSKIEAARMTLEPGEVNLSELIEQVIDNLRPLALDKSLAINTDIPGNLPMLMTDEQKLGLVLTNLVSNAIKFTSEGSVSVSVVKNSSSVTITVKDTGIGIAAEELPKIFREFYQVPGKSSKQRGTGLGLAIVEKLIMLLGGEISVESEVWVGSTFRVELPLAVDISEYLRGGSI